MRSLIYLFCLLPLPALGQIGIYKWEMPDGSIGYSDQPQEEGASPVELSPLQTYEAPVTPAPAAAAGEEEGEGEEEEPVFKGYEEVAVVEPANGATLRDNAGRVSVRLSVRPDMRPLHIIELIVNGRLLGSGRTTTVTLSGVERGTHSVAAVIKDEEGQELARSATVTFHLHRAFKRN
jgi:hypothetical protein